MDAAAVWLRPVGLLRGWGAEAGVEAGSALPLAGGPSAFALVEALALRDGMLVAATSTPAALHGWAAAQGAAMAARVTGQLAALTAKRPAWAGLALDRPLVMGIVNVTPDSFSDGGDFANPASAIAAGRARLETPPHLLHLRGYIPPPA